MTKKQAQALKVGDAVVDRYGIEYAVAGVYEAWNGALTSTEVAARHGKPDYYEIAVKVVPQKREYFKHTELIVAHRK